jgi:hypothetical protein
MPIRDHADEDADAELPTGLSNVYEAPTPTKTMTFMQVPYRRMEILRLDREHTH